jgi:hypothetical protein
MGHPLRIFYPATIYEVTSRTVQGRHLLAPSATANELILGVFGRGLNQHPEIRLHGFAFMSNHWHGLLSSVGRRPPSAFVGYVNGNLARELGPLHGWSGSFWGRRTRPIPVLGDEAMVARFRYLLAQGTKEGLVASPHEAPWPSSLPALLGAHLEGIWVERNEEYKQRRARRPSVAQRRTIRYPVTITPLPCWEALSDNERSRRVEDLVAEIEQEAALVRAASGRAVIGIDRLLAIDPLSRSDDLERTPAPACHASSIEQRVAFEELRCAIDGDYRRASAQLASRGAHQERHIDFPPGTFPAGQPFVPATGPLDLGIGIDGPGQRSLAERLPGRRGRYRNRSENGPTSRRERSRMG